jgi:hypothetical protein
LQTPRTAATNQPKALANAAKFTAAEPRITIPTRELNVARNILILKGYFIQDFFAPEIDTQPSAWANPCYGKSRQISEAFLTQVIEKRHSPSPACVFYKC